MKKMMMAIALAAVCLSQLGCYMYFRPKGECFASTKLVWDFSKDSMPMTFGIFVAGVGMMDTYVGRVTLVPAGVAIHFVECCVIAPAYDIFCLPRDLVQILMKTDSECNGRDGGAEMREPRTNADGPTLTLGQGNASVSAAQSAEVCG